MTGHRGRRVGLEGDDADEVPALGCDGEGIEHGDVEILDPLPGCDKQPGACAELLSPRRSQLRGGQLSTNDRGTPEVSRMAEGPPGQVPVIAAPDWQIADMTGKLRTKARITR